MKPENKIKKLIHNSNITTEPQTDDKILGDALEHLDSMKSPFGKIAAAAMIITAALILAFFMDRGATPVYALEHTIKANHAIETIRLRIITNEGSIENNENSDCWLKYDDAGLLSNSRWNLIEDDGVKFSVLNKGIPKTWMPEKNLVLLLSDWIDFSKKYDPKLIFQRLFDDSNKNETITITIDEPAEQGDSIHVQAVNTAKKTRVELLIDPDTKLVKEFLGYRLNEPHDELDMRIKFLAYNQPIDPAVFELSGIPDDAMIIDRVDQLVGLKKGDLTDKEIAAQVVRQCLEATIEQDYEKASRLLEGDPGDLVEEFIENEFDGRLVRVISAGPTEPHGKRKFMLCVPCEIEVEDEEGAKRIENITAMANPVGYQPGFRWVMHTKILVNEPNSPKTNHLNSQEGKENYTIIPKVGVGDFSLQMSKGEVLSKLGEPKAIYYQGKRYSLKKLPKRYIMFFSHISFGMDGDSITWITVHSPLYKFNNGLGVDDSDEKIKQTFGNDFEFQETEWKDFLSYEDKGLEFEIRKKDRTIMEITVHRIEDSHSDSDDQGQYKMSFEQLKGLITLPVIERHPPAEMWVRGEISKLPDSISPDYYQIDLRNYDLSKLDLSNNLFELLNAEFSSNTIWPPTNKLPSGFNINRIMEYGMDPGLGVRSLHQQGVSGKNVGIAIIDQVLLTKHEQYAARLQFYEEFHVPHGKDADSHGTGCASVALGSTIGVAPEADLYYIATYWSDRNNNNFRVNFTYLASAIRRIIELNSVLPENRSIEVISIARGFSPNDYGYKEVVDAINEAIDSGIFVIPTSPEIFYDNFDFMALGRDVLKDPNHFNSFRPGNWIMKTFISERNRTFDDVVFVPSGSRMNAFSDSPDSYEFSTGGGLSSVAPYIAGVYALAKQVKPGIEIDEFISLFNETASSNEFEYKKNKYSIRKIINPVGIINRIN